jgi:hypothetical protein
MPERVLGQVLRPFEEVDKDPFGRDVGVDGTRDEESGEGQSVGDSLDQDSGASLLKASKLLSYTR